MVGKLVTVVFLFVAAIVLAPNTLARISGRDGLLEKVVKDYINKENVIQRSRDKRSAGSNANLLFCYYTNWAKYRNETATYSTSDVDPFLCTHIMYAFLGFNADGFQILPRDQKDVENLVALKQVNPSLKLIFSLGGANAGSWRFEQISQTEEARLKFASNAATFIREKNFDGLDLDWEYPLEANKNNFALLLKAVHDEFAADASARGAEKLELTAATAAGKWAIDQSYDMNALNNYLDYVLVMAYDLYMYGHWNTKIGLHSALYGSTDSDTLSQEWIIDYYLKGGISPRKLVLGLPTYGRSFTLCPGSAVTPGTTGCGSGAPGTYTGERGVLSYQEICMNNWPSLVDQKQKTPYAYKGNQWVGYDDPDSVRTKVTFLKRSGLAGAMVWTLDLDDFNGQCGYGNYPVITAIQQELGGRTTPSTVIPSTTSSKPSSSTSTPSSTPSTTPSSPLSTSPGAGFPCPSASGFFADPNDCQKYYSCGAGVAHHYTCPARTFFDTTLQSCNWQEMVSCDNNQGNTPSSSSQTSSSATSSTTTRTTSKTLSSSTTTTTTVTTPRTSTTPTSTTTTTKTTTNPATGSEFSCPSKNGLFIDPNDCQRYYNCGDGIAYHYTCPAGTLFDVTVSVCNWKYLVSCYNNKGFQCPSEFGLYPHESDCTKFYHCSHYKPWVKKCPSKLRWDQSNLSCNWPHNVEC